MPRKYEANPKHAVQKGKVSKMDLSDKEAEKLLNSKECFAAKGKAYVAVYKKKKIYAFRMHEGNKYHGYPIPGNEVCRNFSEIQDKVAEVLGVSVKRLSRMR
ncbi:hypothetical protein OAS39_08700 [Pirellulales bacterium]|nr:hypothetical protein [Pirellulales bacterium]